MADLDLIGQSIVDDAAQVFARLEGLPEDQRIKVVNALRLALREHSPMKDEPVDCVLWVPADQVDANDYNPNVVAPPEKKLLVRSIDADGFTQPIVAWPTGEDRYEVVDGFHRSQVGRGAVPGSRKVTKRLRGHLPITVVGEERRGKADRMAATVRHNRARGVHTVDGMAEIVLEMSRRGHPDQKIATELGMDPDEVLRLKQTQGLAETFADQALSEAWEIDPEPTFNPEAFLAELTGEPPEEGQARP